MPRGLWELSHSPRFSIAAPVGSVDLIRFPRSEIGRPGAESAYIDDMRMMPSQLEMNRARRRRDASYDGVFFLAVRTTGVFCRPSCSAKAPRPENVEYFGTARDALQAGYRSCKRCRPMDANGRPPEWVERLLGIVERDPTVRIRDADLRAMSIDPARARRYFSKHYGMTFQVYARARRLGEALTRIRCGADLASVGFDHGYDSASGFRDAFVRTFGGPPGRGRNGHCILSKMLESPLGRLLVCATSAGICLLEFAGQRTMKTHVKALGRRFRRAVVPGTNAHIEQLAGELEQYFAGQLRQFDVALAQQGTAFQMSVWTELRRIPYGRTISYAELANKVGRHGAHRAVGTANGRNPISIVIPCHRVVNKNGRLGGYGGGLWRKQYLLDLERAS